MPPDLEQSTTVARLAADEATAHRIIDLVTESYDPLAAVAGVSEDGPGRWAWRRWTYHWESPSPGHHVLGCRATDDAGNVQPVVPEWNVGGYANNAVQRVLVTVRA